MKTILYVIPLLLSFSVNTYADTELDLGLAAGVTAGAVAATDIGLGYREFIGKRAEINKESATRYALIHAKEEELKQLRIQAAPEPYKIMTEAEHYRVRQIQISQELSQNPTLRANSAWLREACETSLQKEFGAAHAKYKVMNYGELMRLIDKASDEFYGKTNALPAVQALRNEIDRLSGREFRFVAPSSSGRTQQAGNVAVQTNEAFAREMYARGVDDAMKMRLLRGLSVIAIGGVLYYEFGSDTNTRQIQFERDFRPKTAAQNPVSEALSADASHSGTAE